MKLTNYEGEKRQTTNYDVNKKLVNHHFSFIRYFVIRQSLFVNRHFPFLLFLRFLVQPEDSCAGGTLVRYGQGYTGRLWGVVKAVFWMGAAIIAGFYIAQL